MGTEVRDLRAEHAEVSKQSESLPRSADAGETRNAESTTQPEQLRAQSDKPRRQNRATHAQRARQLPIQTVADSERIESDAAGVAGRMLGAENRIPEIT